MIDSTEPMVQLKEQTWIRTYWRPMMAWQYFTVCLFDFIIFPIAAFWWAQHTGVQWNWEPLTLKAGGFYHAAMGIVIGVAAWQRGQENLLRTKMFGPEALAAHLMNNTNEDERMYSDTDEDPPAHPK